MGKQKNLLTKLITLRGYYIIVNFEAAADVVAEVERRSRISDAVIRYMVVKSLGRGIYEQCYFNR